MASINTNVGAMTALQTLTATNKNLATTQSRISTGLRVGEAQDNAAYWSIATTMRSDNKALSSVQDALGLGAGKLDVAYTGMNAAIEVVDEMKAKLVAARGASDDDKIKIQSEITELQNQLKSVGLSANFSGSNFLATDSTAETEIVSSFNRDNAGNVSVGTIKFDVSSSQLFDFDDDGAIQTDVDEASGLLSVALTYVDADGDDVDLDVSVLTLDVTGASFDDIDQMISGVDNVLKSMTTAASDLGAAKKRVDMQTDFISKLSDAIDRGVGQLVDADMQQESARLSALQVQQQLGIQALSIANGNSQNILSLFR
jgi:flagellin